MADQAGTLRAAVLALHHGVVGDLAAQQQANLWLTQFSKQPAAWDACLQLLDVAEDGTVSFVCANILLTKVRADWHKLSGEQQGHMAAVLGEKFQAFLHNSHAQARVATQRLGLVVAAVAALSGAQACQQFATQCLNMVSIGGHTHVAECALQMLTALADELANMDTSRRKGLVQATMAQWDDITRMVAALVPQQMAAGQYGLVTGALACLQSWLKLDPQGAGSCRVSPGQLHSSRPGLMAVLFSLIGAEAAEAVTAERLEVMATEVLGELLGPGASGSDEAVERSAFDACVQALLQLGDKALAPGPSGAGTARAIATLASVLPERDASAAAGASPGALPLAALLLACVSRPERFVAEAAVEYFLMLNAVPVAERAAELGAPLFGRLAPALCRHACYPAGFVGWDEAEEDEEAFNRFREQGLSELLETVHAMMGPPFLAGLRDSLRTGGSWQEVEGGLYCLKAVHLRAKSQAAGGGAVGQDTGEALMSIFGELCSASSASAASLSHPLVCQTAAGLVGAYAAWFGANDASPLEGALQLLLHALAYREAWQDAAQAFRALCSRCAVRLSGSAVLLGLMDVAARAVAPAPAPGQVCCSVGMEWEDRAAVQEGLARVVATLPAEEATDAGSRLLAPHVARAQSIVAYGGGPAQHGPGAAAANGAASTQQSNGSASHAADAQQQGQGQQQQQQQQRQGEQQQQLHQQRWQGSYSQQQLLDMLADELRLVAAILRCMDFPSEVPKGLSHPAIRLLEGCWPLLTSVAESPLCQQDPGLVEAVCGVYNKAVQAAKAAAKPLLPMLLRSVLDIFVKHHHPACLDTLAAVTEAFGEVRSGAEGPEVQRQALAGAAAAADEALRARAASGQPLAASGDLLRSLLAAGDAHLVFARDLCLTSAALPCLIEWAVAAAGLREREPVAPALSLLTHLLSTLQQLQAGGDAPSGDASSMAAAVSGVLMGRGELLVQTLLQGACDTCPRPLLRSLSGVLYGLLGNGSVGPAAAQWLLQALQSPDLPGMSAGLLKPEDCQAFAKLALRQPLLPRGRFDALLMDFAAIPRGEGTSDALLAYEM